MVFQSSRHVRQRFRLRRARYLSHRYSRPGATAPKQTVANNGPMQLQVYRTNSSAPSLLDSDNIRTLSSSNGLVGVRHLRYRSTLPVHPGRTSTLVPDSAQYSRPKTEQYSRFDFMSDLIAAQHGRFCPIRRSTRRASARVRVSAVRVLPGPRVRSEKGRWDSPWPAACQRIRAGWQTNNPIRQRIASDENVG